MENELINSIWIGYSTNVALDQENSTRQGVHRSLTALLQVIAMVNASSQASRLAETGVISNPPWSIVGFIALPIITNVLCSKFDIRKHPRIKRSLLDLNAHISTAAQAVLVASSLGLIATGRPLYGGMTIAWWALGVADRHCYLHKRISQALYGVGFVVSNCARIRNGGFWTPLLAALDIGAAALERISRLLPVATPVQSNILRTAPIADITCPFPNLKWKMDFSAMSTLRAPVKAPDIDLKILDTMFNQIDWTSAENRALVRKELTDDEHWSEFFANQDSDQQQFEYVKTGLEAFVSNVSNRTIKTGAVKEYRSLQNRARHIAATLKDKSDQDQALYLIRLGLASYYCPSGYNEKVKTIYYTVCPRIDEDSLAARLGEVLRNASFILYNRFLYELTFDQKTMLTAVAHKHNPNAVVDFDSCGLRTVTKIQRFYGNTFANPSDNHVWTFWSQVFGENFNPDHAEDLEVGDISLMETFKRKWWQFLHAPLSEAFFLRCDGKFALDMVSEAIANQEIPHSLLERWFVDEALIAVKDENPQYPSEEEREYNARVRAIAETWVRDQVYDVMTGSVKDQYLMYFLYKQRVLQHPISAAEQGIAHMALLGVERRKAIAQHKADFANRLSNLIDDWKTTLEECRTFKNVAHFIDLEKKELFENANPT